MKKLFIILFALIPTLSFAEDKAPVKEISPLQSLIDNVANKTNAAIDKTVENAPALADKVMQEGGEIVREFFIYKAIEILPTLFFQIVCLVAFFVFIVKLSNGQKMLDQINKDLPDDEYNDYGRFIKKNQYNYEDLYFTSKFGMPYVIYAVVVLILLFSSFAWVGGIINNLATLSQIIFTPRIFLIKEIIGFMK